MMRVSNLESNSLLLQLKVLKDGIEDHEKYDRAYWVPLKHAPPGGEGGRSPAWSFHYCLGLGVAGAKILDDVRRDMIPD